MRHVLFSLLALLASGCATLPENKAPQEVILERKDGSQTTRQRVLQEMNQARIIYLGEKHDNPYHHQLQVEVLEHLLASGKRPVLGFETFSRDQTGLLLNFTQGSSSPFKPSSADKQEEFLRRQLGWVHRNEWGFYAPLLRLAKQYRLAVFGADLPTGSKVRLTRSGRQQMYAFEREELFDSGLQSEPYRKLMQGKLSAAHCHTADEGLLERLYQTWLARNDAMAHSIIAASQSLPDQPVVMVLGVGHVEHDMGVLERVAHRQPTWRQVNVGMGELPEEHPPTLPPTVTIDGQTFASSHQFFWLTPPAPDREEEDFCSHMPHGNPPAKR